MRTIFGLPKRDTKRDDVQNHTLEALEILFFYYRIDLIIMEKIIVVFQI